MDGVWSVNMDKVWSIRMDGVWECGLYIWTEWGLNTTPKHRHDMGGVWCYEPLLRERGGACSLPEVGGACNILVIARVWCGGPLPSRKGENRPVRS